jgi:hypothetical protein
LDPTPKNGGLHAQVSPFKIIRVDHSGASSKANRIIRSYDLAAPILCHEAMRRRLPDI